MKRDLLNSVFPPPDVSSGRRVKVTFKPHVSFLDDRNIEQNWLPDVAEVKCWMCVVHGQAHVSQHNGVVVSGRSKPLVSDTFENGDPMTAAQTVILAPGTIVQAGISIVRRNGFRMVTAAVGIVPEPELPDKDSVATELDNAVAIKRSESVSHSATVEIKGVIQLPPADACLITNYREDIKKHGKGHVWAVLNLVIKEKMSGGLLPHLHCP